MDSSKDNTQGMGKTPTIAVPNNSLSGYLGAGTDSGSASGSLPSAEQYGFSRVYGGIFKTVKSCIDLKSMNPAVTNSAPHDLEKTMNDVPDSVPGLLGKPKNRLGGLFRSVQSCANLEEMGATAQNPLLEHSEDHQAKSGLLFGSIKSYLASSNMVSARDLNVTAPISS